MEIKIALPLCMRTVKVRIRLEIIMVNVKIFPTAVVLAKVEQEREVRQWDYVPAIIHQTWTQFAMQIAEPIVIKFQLMRMALFGKLRMDRNQRLV